MCGVCVCVQIVSLTETSVDSLSILTANTNADITFSFHCNPFSGHTTPASSPQRGQLHLGLFCVCLCSWSEVIFSHYPACHCEVD